MGNGTTKYLKVNLKLFARWKMKTEQTEILKWLYISIHIYLYGKLFYILQNNGPTYLKQIYKKRRDRNTGDKWLIHDPQHHKDNESQSLKHILHWNTLKLKCHSEEISVTGCTGNWKPNILSKWRHFRCSEKCNMLTKCCPKRIDKCKIFSVYTHAVYMLSLSYSAVISDHRDVSRSKGYCTSEKHDLHVFNKYHMSNYSQHRN